MNDFEQKQTQIRAHNLPGDVETLERTIRHLESEMATLKAIKCDMETRMAAIERRLGLNRSLSPVPTGAPIVAPTEEEQEELD